MKVEVELTDEQVAWLRQGDFDAPIAAAQHLLSIAEAVLAALPSQSIKVGDTVRSRGGASYRTVLAIDDEVAWVKDRSGWHTVPVAELERVP